MNCPDCKQASSVLQTFSENDKIIRVRGHRDSDSCWNRFRTVERYEDSSAEVALRMAQDGCRNLIAVKRKLSEAISEVLAALMVRDDYDDNETIEALFEKYMP